MPQRRNAALILTFLLVSSFLASAIISLWTESRPVSLSIYPMSPKPGDAVTFTVAIRNPYGSFEDYEFKFFVEGSLRDERALQIGEYGSKSFSYRAIYPYGIGRTINAYAEVKNVRTGELFTKFANAPPYPAEMWSSFASFATFATSSFATTTSSFASTTTSFASSSNSFASSSSSFASSSSSLSSTSLINSLGFYTPSLEQTTLFSVNIGLVFSLSFIALAVFLELSNPSHRKVGRGLSRLRSNYVLLTIMLFLIFAGMVATRIVLIVMGG